MRELYTNHLVKCLTNFTKAQTMKRYFLLFVLAVVTLGCTKSTSNTPSSVRISPTITRIAGLYFESGDAIGLTITKQTEVYADNIQMLYDGTTFTANDLLWYNPANETSTLTAYYPYSSDAVANSFTVATDQTAGCESSDLLLAMQQNVTPSAAPVSMLFHHVMVQLTIVLTNDASSAISGVSIGGLIPNATIDYTTLSATADTGSPADIQACEITPDAEYQVILVPQTGVPTLSVTTTDGQIHTKTLPEQSLAGGKRYDMSVTVTDNNIDVAISGEIADWEEGGSLNTENGNGTGNGDGDGGNETDNILSYHGTDYPTVVIGNKTWMAANLQYLPDESLLQNGIWYPFDGTNPNADLMEELGLLYSFEPALGETGSATRAATDEVQGICPDGWHIPSIDELQALVDDPQYDSSFFIFAGAYISGKYLKADTRGCLMSSTVSPDSDSYQAMVLLKGKTPGVVPYASEDAVSVRCVKNS